MSKVPPLGQTPSQTVGPFFAYGLSPRQYGYALDSVVGPAMADESVVGERIRVEGQVLDGAGAPITDALIEFWQADADGVYRASDGVNARFSGFGRCGTGTDAEARFWFETIKPGVAADEADRAAPCINVTVLMRGLLSHVFTRLYFSDEAEANARDEVLLSVPPERRATLIADLVEPGHYKFDIRMQGDDETVFFDL